MKNNNLFCSLQKTRTFSIVNNAQKETNQVQG